MTFGSQNLQTLLEKLPFAIIVMDAEERVLYLNAAAERLYQCRFATVVNKPVSSLMFLSKPQMISEAVERAFKNNIMVNLEWDEEQYYEGRVFWRQGTILPLPDQNGKVESAVMTILDVTETVRSQNKLLKSLEHYQALFEYAPDAILILKETQIIGANPAGEKLTGYKKEELNGKYLWELSPELHAPSIASKNIAEEKVSNALRGDSQLFAWKCLTKAGKLLATEVNLALMSSPHVPQSIPLLQAVIRETKQT